MTVIMPIKTSDRFTVQIRKKISEFMLNLNVNVWLCVNVKKSLRKSVN